MSDPVTNVEIEDVLASIRKLVAQGDRGDAAAVPKDPDTASAGAGAAANAPDSPMPDRLVLTPALRVAETPDAEPEQEPTAEDDAPAAEVVEAPITLTRQPAPQDVAGDTPVEEFEIAGPETEAGEVEAEQASETMVAEDAPIAVQPAETNPEDISEIHWEEPEHPANRASLLATIAELEAAVGGGVDEWEPDGSEAAPAMDWEDMTVPPQESTAPRIVPDAAEAEEAEADLVGEVSPTEDLSVGTAHAVDAAPVPDPEIEDGAEDPAALHDGEDFDPEELDEDLSAFMTSEQTIDEEMLRDLVAEIVREELQGALGERITRNVRKLVRREIYRILSSQDFD